MIMKHGQRFWNLFLASAMILALTIAPLPGTSVHAQTVDPGVSIATRYTQNFNSLISAGSSYALSTHIPGWYANLPAYKADSGTTSVGYLYSYGAIGSSERALGALTNTTYSPIEFAVKIVNDSDQTIHHITVQYTGEQWRLGSNTNTIAFSYQLNPASPISLASGTWVPVPALDFVGLKTNPVANPLEGNLAENRRQITATIPVTLNPTESMLLKWSLSHGTLDYDQALAVDDLTISADEPPALISYTPANGATGVLPGANITLNFSEPVSLVSGAASILCNGVTPHPAVITPNLGNTIFTLDPEVDFTPLDSCTVTIDPTKVTDIDTDDPPDAMSAPVSFNFTIADPPAVTSTNPDATSQYVPLNTPIAVTFSRAVTVSPGWLDLVCTSSGTVTSTTASAGPSATITAQPDAPLGVGESCTATVLADKVSADEGGTPLYMLENYTWTFTAIGTGGDTHIHDVQGAAHRSPLVETAVTDVYGIVTALTTRGFYMQSPTPDENTATSEGIYVFLNTAPAVAVGDGVLVTGKVTEYRASASGLSVTEITSPEIHFVQSGLALPAPILLGTGGRIPPHQVIEDDATQVETDGVFDPDTDGIDFYESLEGMRVQVNNAVATGGTNAYGEISVLGDNGEYAGQRTQRGGIIIQSNDYNPERILLDDLIIGSASMPHVTTGATFTAPILGVMDYSFGNFKLEVTAAPAANASTLSNETAPAAAPNQLTVVTYNVGNLDPRVESSSCVSAANIDDDTTRFVLLAEHIVNNLNTPDIIGLQEIRDNDGAENAPVCSGGTAVVDASVTLDAIVSAIEDAGGPTYTYRQINPVNNSDGGQLNANGRVAFLYNPARVTFVDRGAGDAVTATAVTGTGTDTALTLSPGRINPMNSAFASSPKSLAGEFLFHGNHVFVILNHFNSRSGDQPLFGVNQPPVLLSETQRIAQATAINDFVGDLLTANPTAQVVVMGDLNDFPFSAPLQTLARGADETVELNDLHSQLPIEEQYTTVYDGNSEALDAILVSPALKTLASVDIVHMNAERFAGDLEKMSDHDPLLAALALPNSTPTATPQTLDAVTGVTLPITLSGTDADGDPLTYTVSTQPQHGALTGIAPDLSYAADPGYQGEDSFTFTVSDGLATSAAATITLHVTAVPVANGALPDQTAYVHLPFRYTFPADAFIDNPGDMLTYTAHLGTGDPLPAWLVFDAAARTFSGTPPAGSAGTTLVIQITATDSGGASGSVSFNLNVLPPPHSLYVPLIMR